MVHHTDIKIRGYHLDLYGHVNNARYLEFMEEARWAFLETHCDFDAWHAKNLAFYIVNINIDYVSGAALHDNLRIKTHVHKLGTRSATLSQKGVLKEDPEKIIFTSKVTFVLADRDKNCAIPIDNEIRAELESLR